MDKKPNQPAETAKRKKQIETIVGHEIDPHVEGLIKFSYPAGSYTAFGEVLPSESHVCWRRIFPFPNKAVLGSHFSTHRRLIYPGGWQAGVSRERCCVPPGRNAGFW